MVCVEQCRVSIYIYIYIKTMKADQCMLARLGIPQVRPYVCEPHLLWSPTKYRILTSILYLVWVLSCEPCEWYMVNLDSHGPSLIGTATGKQVLRCYCLRGPRTCTNELAVNRPPNCSRADLGCYLYSLKQSWKWNIGTWKTIFHYKGQGEPHWKTTLLQEGPAQLP